MNCFQTKSGSDRFQAISLHRSVIGKGTNVTDYFIIALGSCFLSDPLCQLICISHHVMRFCLCPINELCISLLKLFCYDEVLWADLMRCITSR